jgi:cytochrome bd-type quinol oxidase subunit 2
MINKKAMSALRGVFPILTLVSLSGVAQAATFENPLGPNMDNLKAVLTSLLNHLAGVIVLISIIFIVIGGLMYMMSAGDEKMITRAKNTVTAAMIGLAIALAAPTFLKEIMLILGGPPAGNPDNLVSNALTVQQIAMGVLKFLLSVVGIIAIISLVIGGATYLTAYGDEKRIDKAKSIIKYSIIGIIVVLAALVIANQIGKFIAGTA